METMPVKGNAADVRFKDVTKIYGSDVVAVDNVSLDVKAGTLVTLLGPSGCGKTSTLRMIAGLEGANKGQIFIGDQDVTQVPASERDVSMVFQSYALFPHKTVLENVCYGLLFSGLSKADASIKARAGLELVGLEQLSARYPSELSGGQQQRVAVARALVLEPQVLLFDEPLSNLDAKLRRSVREEIRELQQKLVLTVVYVTHDQEEALAVSDQIVVMNQGRIAQVGAPSELYERPSDLFVANFIGESNIFDCQVERVAAGKAFVRLGDALLEVPGHANAAAGPARLVIRPEHISLTAQAGGTGVHGKVEHATYVGSKVEYQISAEAGEMFVIMPSDKPRFARGDTLFMQVLPERMLLFPVS